MPPAQAGAHIRLPAWLLVSIVAAIGFNLRATLGAIPPLLDSIGEDLVLSASTAALLTSVPILCMGLFAPVSQLVAARIGAEGTAAILLGVLAVSSLMRFWVGSIETLLFSTALAGIGMGGISSLMPGLIFHHLPRIPGAATGVYSMAMAGGVAIAAWIAGPTADLLGGWRPALALWGLAAGITTICWSALLPRLSAAAPRDPVLQGVARGRLPWHSPTARRITTFTTLNMLIGFSGVAWIAPTFVHHGFSPQHAAGLFALFQIIQLGAMLSLPLLTDFTRDRRPLLALTVVSTGTGLSLMVLAPTTLALPAVMLFGTGVGGASSLALILIQDATSTQSEAGRLGAMVLSVSFLAGAAGPLLLGSMRDLTGGFTAGYGILLMLSVACLAMLPVFRPGRTVNDVLPHTPPLPGIDTAGG
ncbi:MFS transporter [Haloactinomyces albus]|uniref:CP family cyanate transporter-like MFS transporter n=1 Tax=Haloactinomyces albus TaxID=1352928 RepID=A0AAE3ZIN5_9ACTN|nr:MFS transporter [Haloactinomyces albus]MDR7303922.1 CP family cyanate transporter-like MFS transporter [Haloactinomyces albus]